MVDLIPVDHEPEFHEPEFDAAMPPAVSPEMLSLLATARERLKTQPNRFPTSYGTPEADAAAMMPETYVNPLVKSGVDAVLPDVHTTEKYPFLPRPSDFKQSLDELNRQSAESATTGSVLWPLETVTAPINAAIETAKKAARRTGPGLEQAVDVASMANPEGLVGDIGKAALAGAPIVGSARKAVKGAKAAEETAPGMLKVSPEIPPAGQKTEAAYKGPEGATPDASVQVPAAGKAPVDVTGGVAGPSGGDAGVREAQLQAERRAAGRAPLPGLPQGKQIVEGEPFVPGPVASVHDVADRYMADKNFGVPPPEKYHEIDKEHSKAIAEAYDKMEHAPNDPAVKASYDALIRETLAQYQAIKDSGLKITPVGAADYPYHGNPRAVAKDIADNNHMAFFKTDEGFGTGSSKIFDELPDETKLDIAHSLMDRVPALEEHARGRVEDVMQLLEGAHPPIPVKMRDVDPASIVSAKQTSKAAVNKYAQLGTEPPPIVMHGDDLVEGGHRVAAAKQSGRQKLSAADISDLSKMDWEAWLNGENPPIGTAEHPMLQPSGEKIGDHELLNNDLFRIVHDYFGHVKNGYGFRGAGEDNAWRAHAAMYSPEARPAMTSETRGQNSWVNYGPHGDFNRTASGADTIYAPQKVGLMPDWTMQDRGATPTAPTVPGMLGTKPPESAAGTAPAAQGAGGLSFPAEEAADRLRMKLQREQKAKDKGTEMSGAPTNDRTVVKAPEGSNLPDFVAGKITPQDWVTRHEKLLSPEEIAKSSKWYDEISDHFLQQANGDKDKAAKYMRAWLVAQQNVDVGGAMGNALLQREQVLRGVPENEMKAAGMPNPTVAARRVFQDQPIEGGVGHKIADFVDAAEGKDVRSWMGNDPRGGAPFVVDVHTARDTGLVDQRLVNHLERLGYDPETLKNLKLDWGGPNGDSGGLSAPTYENRAKFGRELTDHLNDIKWQGRDDWKPREVQAVGWMGMTKMTANQADDVATGLAANRRHLSMELAPGEGSPWAAKYGDRFAALPPEAQRQLTHQISEDAINRVSQIAGVDVRDIVHGTGGWQTVQNPSTVAQAFASKQGGEIAANALGHLLQQTEVWSNKVKAVTANPKGFAVDFIADGNHNIGTDAGLRDFWSKIMAADPTASSKSPLFQGYQPIKMPDGRVGIRALIDRGGVGTKTAIENAISGPIKDMVEKLPHDVEVRSHEAEIYKAHNDWTKDKDGQAYRQRLVDLVGPDRAAQLDSHGAELEKRFSSAIEAAESGGKGGTGTTGGGSQVTSAAPAPAAAPPAAAAPASNPQTALVDAIRGVRAYHGSPHDFDKFDLSKIGTGEGAQAYGHGLYFADREGVAKSYRDALASDPRDAVSKYIEGIQNMAAPEEITAESIKTGLSRHDDASLRAASSDPSIINDIVTASKGRNPDGTVTDEALKAFQRLDKNLPAKTPGRMYEVNINADPEHFLDWDKPLSEHTGPIADAFGQEWANKVLGPNATGKDLYQWIAGGKANNPATRGGDRAARDLSAQGIPGIKYLDQGSRNVADLKIEPHEFNDGSKGFKVNGPKGDMTFDTKKEAQKYIDSQGGSSTRNYVVFNDKLIDILKKYGIAGLLPAAGAATGAMQTQPSPADMVNAIRGQGG